MQQKIMAGSACQPVHPAAECTQHWHIHKGQARWEDHAVTVTYSCTQEFAAPEALGISQLVQYLTVARAPAFGPAAQAQPLCLPLKLVWAAGTHPSPSACPESTPPSPAPPAPTVASSAQWVPDLQHHLLSVEHIASLLVSLPDRVAPYTCSLPEQLSQAVMHTQFYTHLLSVLLSLAAQLAVLRGEAVEGGQAGDGCAQGRYATLQAANGEPAAPQFSSGMGSTGAASPLHLAAAVAARLCRRGHAAEVAAVLVSSACSPTSLTLTQPPAPISNQPPDAANTTASSLGPLGASHGVQFFPVSPHGSLEADSLIQRVVGHGVGPALSAYLLTQPPLAGKLLPLLLQRLAANDPNYSAAQPWQPPMQPPARLPAAQAAIPALQALLTFLPRGLVASQPELQFLLGEQLLAHSPQPTPALHLLVAYLQAMSEQPLRPNTPAAPPASQRFLPQQLSLSVLQPGWWHSQLAAELSTSSLHGGFEGGFEGSLEGEERKQWWDGGAGDEGGEGLEDGDWAAECPGVVEALQALSNLWADVAVLGPARHPPGGRRVAEGGRREHPGVGPGAVSATARAAVGLPRQAYLSCALCVLLGRVTRAQVGGGGILEWGNGAVREGSGNGINAEQPV